AQREQIDSASFDYAGQGFDAREQLLIKIDALFAFRVFVARQGDAHAHNVFGLDAEIGLENVDEAAHHQSSADKEHKRERNLSDDKRAAPSVARGTYRTFTATLFQNV